jgi:ATP-binding cassette subfamily B protein
MFQSEVKQSLWVYLSSMAQTVSSYLGVAAVMIIGVYLVSSDQLSTGAFVAFLFYFFNGIEQSSSLIRQLMDQRVLFIELEKVHEIMSRKADVHESPHPTRLPSVRGQISIENVHFSYPKHPNVLKGISLVIEAGKKVAWVGPSGGGKSTLYKLVGRFYDPSSGKILLDGVDYRDLELGQLGLYSRKRTYLELPYTRTSDSDNRTLPSYKSKKRPQQPTRMILSLNCRMGTTRKSANAV